MEFQLVTALLYLIFGGKTTPVCIQIRHVNFFEDRTTILNERNGEFNSNCQLEKSHVREETEVT